GVEALRCTLVVESGEPPFEDPFGHRNVLGQRTTLPSTRKSVPTGPGSRIPPIPATIRRIIVRLSRGSASQGRRGSGRSAASPHDTPWGSGVGPTARVSRTCAARDQAPGDDRRCSGHGRQDEPQHTDGHEHHADFFGQVFDPASPTRDGRKSGLTLVSHGFGLSVRGRGVHGIGPISGRGIGSIHGATAPGRHSSTYGRSWPLWMRASSASAILLSSLSNVLNTLRSLLRRRLIS